MSMINYDGQADGAVEVGSVTAGATDGAESLNDAAATAAGDQVDSATQTDSTTEADTRQQVWNGQEWVLKYRDKPVIPQSKDELIKWAQLGYNNDLRMKTLDKRESTMVEREKSLEQIKALSEAFDQRPDFKQSVLGIYQKLMNGEQAAAEQQADNMPDDQQAVIAPYLEKISSLEQKLQGIEGRFSEIDNSKADEAVKSEIDQLKKEHTGEDWDTPDSQTEKTLLREVLEHASKNGFHSLEAAYRDLRWETAMANAKAEALKGADSAAQAAQRAGIVGKGGQGMPSAPKQVNVRNASYSDLSQLAMSAMK